MNAPAGIDPATYATALADVRALRPYGTYQATPEWAPPTEDPRCGTRPGYRAHRARGEHACQPCRAANTAADHRYKATGTTLAQPTT